MFCLSEPLPSWMKEKGGKRIANGHDAKAPIPWMAALFLHIERYDGWILNCGGIIINEFIVLSAAHCLQTKSPDGKWISDTDLGKYLLVLSLLKRSELNTTQIHKIKNIVIHPKWKPGSHENGYDIAILKTKRPIYFTPTIQPICLPSKEDLPIGLISQ